ncbi:MAG: hypothetical protein MR782_00465 [Campylobacter sp.]|uniref:hypothetical protein n=1 Tax=Campylobacter sp. TaxID=205 RepID=UPI002AA685BB|nr:hypothetical protein [Campylobacter sp.]MCI6339327.1 hypothetical protein [Campylobacter sp.]MCI7015369.1 hypothetical protein [Campylobacter sp.]MCI7581704.1 hypothetical protein [Campylobacter sp.]
MSISLLGQNLHFSFSNFNPKAEGPETNTELLKPVSFGSNDIKLGDESISLLKSKFGSGVAEIDGQIKLSSEAEQFVNAMFSALKSDLQDISSKFAQALEYYSLDTSDWCEPISLATILQMLLKAEISGQNALSNEEKLLVKSSFGADSLDKISQKLDLGGEFKALKIDLATNILADMSKGFKV